jgi:hypothetical protein
VDLLGKKKDKCLETELWGSLDLSIYVPILLNLVITYDVWVSFRLISLHFLASHLLYNASETVYFNKSQSIKKWEYNLSIME